METTQNTICKQPNNQSILIIENTLLFDKHNGTYRKDSMYMFDWFKKNNINVVIKQYSYEYLTNNSNICEIVSFMSNFNKIIIRINGAVNSGLKELNDIINKYPVLRSLIVTNLDHIDIIGNKTILHKLCGKFDFIHPGTLLTDVDNTIINILKLNNNDKIVLKTTHGSVGDGVFKIEKYNDTFIFTSAYDNSKQIYDTENIGNIIMNIYEKYENDKMILQQYIKGIVRGEIRIIFLFDKPILIVKKIPAVNEFSATLFSGATYISYNINEYLDEHLYHVKSINEIILSVNEIKNLLNLDNFPLLWTMDFIPENEFFDVNLINEQLYLCEINCTCVGFSSDIQLTEHICNAILEFTS
jgi:glutathione synthase/RimK-type ligase-like ATP-grasp enzyme